MRLPLRLNEFADQINRRPRLWLGIYALLMAMQVGPWWYPTDDGSTYLSLGRCLIEGRPLASLGLPDLGIPPGYSVLIAPTFLLSDRPFLAISLIHWVLAIVLMIGVYRWARRQIPEAAVLITGLVMLNAAVWFYYRRTLKEMAFLTSLVWAADALDGLFRITNWRQLAIRIPLAAVLVVVAVMVRYSAVVLFAGFGAALLLRLWRNETRRPQAVALTASLGVTALAVVVLLVLYGGTSYLRGFVDPSTSLVERVSDGVRQRLSDVGRVAVAGMFKSYSDAGWADPNMAIHVPMFAIIALGCWRLGWRREDLLALTFPFYFLLYVAWPYGQAARFMVPMVPVLVACVWFGLEGMARWRPAVFVASLAAHFIMAFGYWVAVDAPRAIAGDSYWQPVDRFTGEIAIDQRDAVALGVVPPRLRNMLEVSLDRRTVPTWGACPASLPSVNWVVQEEGQPLPPGFVLHRREGNLALLHRAPAPPVAPAPVFAEATTAEDRKVVR